VAEVYLDQTATADAVRGRFLELGSMTAGAMAIALLLPFAGVLVTLRRIAGQRRQLLEARERAREAEKVRSQFIARMSHDLRTPLNAVIGFSEMIKLGDEFTKDPDRVRDYAGHIHASGTTMLNLVNDILDLSTLEARHKGAEIQPVDLAVALKEVLVELQHAARARNIEIRTEVPLPAPSPVVDPGALRRVLSNLVSNAIKYNADGGTVTVSARMTESEVAIRVADTGQGIANEKLSQITLPFIQGDDDASTSRDGFGLGLSIVQALVAEWGGRMTIESELGAGTTVEVTVPLNQ
jgi:signal transduction histidine kinase